MSIDSERIAQLEADLAAVWERKREFDAVEVELRAQVAKLKRTVVQAAALLEASSDLAARREWARKIREVLE